MSRRTVLIGLAAILVVGGLACRHVQEDPLVSLALGPNDDAESRAAFRELLRTLREVEANVRNHPAASAEGYRALHHGLQHALVHGVERDRGREVRLHHGP